MKACLSDTIVAIATPPGEGGIGVIRISGPAARPLILKVFRAKTRKIKPRAVISGAIIHPRTKKVLDQALITYFPAPNSYTGDDVVEISAHGSQVTLQQIQELLIKQGARLAERGEFTKRAFLNGKIDLAQAEAVIDLIKARTGVGAEMALGQLLGKLSGPINKIREQLIKLLTELEASIDYPEDVEEIKLAVIRKRIQPQQKEIRALLDSAEKGRLCREGLRTAIVGRPNVGKSSLLNALLREERAIVTEVPGTTRDTIEEAVDIGGLPLIIIDTAGIRHTNCPVELAGVGRTRKAIEKAELVLWVVDSSQPLGVEDRQIAELIKDKARINVLNKMDLNNQVKAKEIEQLSDAPIIKISASNGEGIPALEKMITKNTLGVRPDREPLLTNVRHKECLTRAQEALERLGKAIDSKLPADIMAIDLKEAIVDLGEITGEAVSEEIIRRIFSEFCVGK